MSYDFGISRRVEEFETSGDIIWGGSWDCRPLFGAFASLGTPRDDEDDDVYVIPIEHLNVFADVYDELADIAVFESYLKLCRVDDELAQEYFNGLPVGLRSAMAMVFSHDELCDVGPLLWQMIKGESTLFAWDIIDKLSDFVHAPDVAEVYLWQSY